MLSGVKSPVGTAKALRHPTGRKTASIEKQTRSILG